MTVSGATYFDVLLRRDGTAWATGSLPLNLLGTHLPHAFAEEPVRIGDDSDWARVIGNASALLALKKDGRLYLNALYARHFFGMTGMRRPSRYADWIAIGQFRDCAVTLAADGTLCAWNFEPYDRGLLGPSRKPVWSLNILAAK
jgi:hypothetical protein